MKNVKYPYPVIVIFVVLLSITNVVLCQDSSSNLRYRDFLGLYHFKSNSIKITDTSYKRLDSLSHYLMSSSVFPNLEFEISIVPYFCEKEKNEDPFLGIKRAKVIQELLLEKTNYTWHKLLILDPGLYETGNNCDIKAVRISLTSRDLTLPRKVDENKIQFDYFELDPELIRMLKNKL